MVDRRSAGADALSVFDQALNQHLNDTAQHVRDLIVGAIKEGATTTRAIVAATGLAVPVVEKAIGDLIAAGRVTTTPPPKSSGQPRKAAPKQPVVPRKAAAG